LSRRRTLGWAILVGLVLGALAGYWSGRKNGYALSHGQPSLEQKTRRLEMEYPLAMSKKPYLILDLLDSRLEYRLSGMTLKSLPVQIESIREKGREGRLVQGGGLLLELEDRGAPPEVIVPPDPNKPVDPLKDLKLFPPDPPTDFTLVFDRSVKMRFVAMDQEGWKAKIQGVGRAVKGWLPWGPGTGKDETRIQLQVPAVEAQEIYRALYQHERVLVLGLSERESVTADRSDAR